MLLLLNQTSKDKLGERAIAGAVVGTDDDGLSYCVLELGTQKICDVENDKPAPPFSEVTAKPEQPEEAAADTTPTVKRERKSNLHPA